MKIANLSAINDFDIDYSLEDEFIHNDINYRGTFNPLSFTIRTSLKFSKEIDINNICDIIDYSNFIHEITHYQTFTGTIFGLEYNLLKTSQQLLLNIILNDNNISNISYPLIGNYFNILDKYTKSSFNDNIIKYMLPEHYISQIISGSTDYRSWRNSNPEIIKLIDPHLFVEDVNSFFPICGLTVIENWARYNQELFIYNDEIDANMQTNILKSLTNNPDYISILYNLRMYKKNIEYLFPYLSFIAFNYPLELGNINRRFNNFTISSRLIKLINSIKSSKDIPSVETAFCNPHECIDHLCKLSNVDNPLCNIENALNNFKQHIDYAKRNFAEIDLCVKVLNNAQNKMRNFLFWPMTPTLLNVSINKTLIGPSIPIWNIIYRDTNINGERHALNVESFDPSFFSSIERSVHRRITNNDLFHGIKYKKNDTYFPGIRCPFQVTRGLCPDNQQSNCMKIFRFDRNEKPPIDCNFIKILKCDYGSLLLKHINFY